MSYYDDLEVPRTASAEQIEKAYRDLSKKCHPDANPGHEKAAAKAFKRIQEAYDILKNPRSRAAYDETLRHRDNPNYRGSSSASPNSGDAAPPQRPRASSKASPPPDPPDPEKRTLVKNPMFIAICIGSVLLLAAGLTTVIKRPPKEDASKEAAKEEKPDHEAIIAAREAEEKLREIDAEAARNEAKRKREIAITKVKLTSIKQEGDKVFDVLKTLKAEIDAWDEKIVPLLTNAQGQSIAADDGRIRAFRAIWEKKRPTIADEMAIRERVEGLLEPISSELAKADPIGEPDEKLSAQLKAETAAIRSAIDEIKEPRRQIERLVEVATRQGKTSPLNLKDAIEDLSAREEDERSLKLAETEKKLKEEEAETADRIMQEESKGRQERSDAAVKAGIEKKKLEAKAKSPATRTLLAFFFTPGYHQPDGTETTEKRPISLSRLEAKGCLEQSPEGQEKLLVWALLNGGDNDRPKWKEAPILNNLSASKREKLLAIQKALIELGPTLVELNMLDP